MERPGLLAEVGFSSKSVIHAQPKFKYEVTFVEP